MGCAPSKPVAVENLILNTTTGKITGGRTSNNVGPATENSANTTASTGSQASPATSSPPGHAVATAKSHTRQGRSQAAKNSPLPSVRSRADSWALPQTTGSPEQLTEALESEIAGGTPATVGNREETEKARLLVQQQEQQWKYLWDTFSQQIADPVDVPAVLDELLDRTVNLLSPVQLTLIQRKVRAVVRALPVKKSNPSHASASKMINKLMSSSNVTNGNSEHEARIVAERYHLLTEHVILRILPSIPSASRIHLNAISLMLHMTNCNPEGGGGASSLWDRTAQTASHAAQAAGLEMDVNRNIDRATWKMPKPSIVPDLAEPPDLPVGVTLQALSAVVALALQGSRAQRLQLLFYLCMDPDRLRVFLTSHPAGGVPTWLFEVGGPSSFRMTKQRDDRPKSANYDDVVVVSLASLTHYHYYGHAFLPTGICKRPFYPSQSRKPAQVSAATVKEMVSAMLWLSSSKQTKSYQSQKDDAATAEATSTAETVEKEVVPPVVLSPTRKLLPHSRQNSKKAVDGQQSLLNGSENGNGSGFFNNSSHHSGALLTTGGTDNNGNISSPPTEVMKMLAEASKEPTDPKLYEDSRLAVSRDQVKAASLDEEDDIAQKSLWTLQDFLIWAEKGLDDLALDAVMYRLFGVGILPSPSMEREIVRCKWEEWQRTVESMLLHSGVDSFENFTFEMIAKSVRALLDSCQNGIEVSDIASANKLVTVWGGLGGIDGGGGIGRGVLYCIGKAWWDSWVAYSGWSFLGDPPSRRQSLVRPAELSTEPLLARDADLTIGGCQGSYELMKTGLKRGKEYVLVPPGVWDVLYEMYGGGPPLPRMIKSPERKLSDMHRLSLEPSESSYGDDEELDAMMEDLDSSSSIRVQKIPDSLSVALHPWVIHCFLCDPLQPYRRGEAGLLSIRIMAMPDQPLWRIFVEALVRFPLQTMKAFDVDGRGKARLWKKTEFTGPRDPAARYGPWNLLCKNRHSVVPSFANGLGENSEENFQELIDNWKDYTDNATVEGAGIGDQDYLMLEVAVQSKNGGLMWPKEAAAKAGKVRRLAEEDAAFRQQLQGVDKDGNLLLKQPNLIGLDVDASDSKGKWYPVKILAVEVIDEPEEDAELNDNAEKSRQYPKSQRKVKVDFQEYGGHIEWIDVDSDRVAKAGRFTSEAEQQSNRSLRANTGLQPNSGDKTKPTAAVKKTNSTENSVENTKLCPFPGLGACGLTNLGNTCYMNSALQCISYLPLLRAYLLSSQYRAIGDLNKDNPLGTGGRLLEESAELLRHMWSSRSGEKSPRSFKIQLGKINSQFAGADQQDAQEFLNYMLDVLHEDSNRVRKKPYVEALSDDWVKVTSLPRVADEAWRRFLRRNRSIMADVAMGQVLNTVTCPVCYFSSRNFDPFNLLSIPVPTVADVIFQVKVVRRSTALNCPWILNRPRKADRRPSRFLRKLSNSTSPPSELHLEEQYVVALSRLADSGDLRIQIQNLCGISASKLRLCRSEEVAFNDENISGSVVGRETKLIPLNDKEGPCSQLAKRRTANNDVTGPTQIIAFENSLNPRQIQVADLNGESQKADVIDGGETGDETADEEEEDNELDSPGESDMIPSDRERAEIEQYLNLYGDEQECRFVDTDPLLIAKAISRSLWPRSDADLKVGLRVDAKDHRGNWFPGSVVELVDSPDVGESDVGEAPADQKLKVKVHFDNFLPKWDEVYSFDQFEGRVRPLHSHSTPKGKPTEFMVHHRYSDRESGLSHYFGQPFYLQCWGEWSNARAGAHILAQASRFLRQSSTGSVADLFDREGKAQRLYEKTQSSISDLIDLLVDCDSEYVRLALGLSEHNREEERTQPYRNPSFDATSLSNALIKKVAAFLHRLPFEVRVCNVDTGHAAKPSVNAEESSFPFTLMRTIGNFMSARNGIILHWREPPTDKKNNAQTNYLNAPVMYVEPSLEIHQPTAEILKKTDIIRKDTGSKNHPGSGGIDLAICLTEFCKVQKLSLSDNWHCPRCKEFREGEQNMHLWRLPDLLTFHIKRFNMSARWREKITTKVNFPLTGLDLSEWCHKESPMMDKPHDSCVYDLIGVMNHYGSMTGGHYVATCKATVCGRDGKEEVGYSFNGVGTSTVEIEDSEVTTGWKFVRTKAEANQNKIAAALLAKSTVTSAEPTWLQFDDEVVETLPPSHVVADSAYVLFYRRRRITPSNIAKYSTLE